MYIRLLYDNPMISGRHGMSGDTNLNEYQHALEFTHDKMNLMSALLKSNSSTDKPIWNRDTPGHNHRPYFFMLVNQAVWRCPGLSEGHVSYSTIDGVVFQRVWMVRLRCQSKVLFLYPLVLGQWREVDSPTRKMQHIRRFRFLVHGWKTDWIPCRT